MSAAETGPYDLRHPRRQLECRKCREKSDITAPRPVAGRTSTSVQCRGCRELIDCTVYSVRAARRLRIRLCGCAIAVLACTGGAVVGLYRLTINDEPGEESSFLESLGSLALFLAIGITGICAGLLFVRAWTEDGIRLATGRRTHSLYREPPFYPSDRWPPRDIDDIGGL